MWLKGLSIIALLLSLTGCFKPPYQNVNNEELKQLLAQGVPIYDIRRPEEWRKTGVVENSRLLTSFDQSGRLKPNFLPTFTREVAKDAPVVLICRTGNRTDAIARYLMEELGYTKVYNVRNGITHWIGDKNAVKRL